LNLTNQIPTPLAQARCRADAGLIEKAF